MKKTLNESDIHRLCRLTIGLTYTLNLDGRAFTLRRDGKEIEVATLEELRRDIHKLSR